MGHGNSGMTKKKEVLSEFFVNFFHVFRIADLLSNCSNLDITATTIFHEKNMKLFFYFAKKTNNNNNFFFREIENSILLPNFAGSVV